VSTGLADFYEAGYTQADPERAALLGRWRAHGADLKAGHITTLCARAGRAPRSVIEIGCGDGALLSALAARGFAVSYDGFELSEPAALLARDRNIPGAGRIESFDGSRVPAGDATYDLAVLSHVLEHVPDPLSLLREAARVARAVLVEVPLEHNRSAARPHKRAEARGIGHIQAFDRADIHALATAAGLRVFGELTDPLPVTHHAFFAASPAERVKGRLKWGIRTAVWRAAPQRAERLFTVHHAALLGR